MLCVSREGIFPHKIKRKVTIVLTYFKDALYAQELGKTHSRHFDGAYPRIFPLLCSASAKTTAITPSKPEYWR